MTAIDIFLASGRF